VAAALCLVAITARAGADQRSGTLEMLLEEAVARKRVPMAVAMVADRDAVVFDHAGGVSKDAIFAIASMTKPITSVAVMQLVDAGKVDLDRPASTYVAELASVRVLDGSTMRAPRSPITVRQLLTHTAGFGYEFLNPRLFALVGKKQIPSIMEGGDAFLRAPLVAEPGATWEYGISTDWLGRLVARVSGQSLEAYLREKVFAPLGMVDTTFEVPSEKRARLATVFQRMPDGALVPQPRPAAAKVEFYSGGGGLFSTAADYMRFLRALMEGGELGGRRVLSAQSVAAMGRSHIGDLRVRPMPSTLPQFATNEGVMPGELDKFGLGFALNTQPTQAGRGANTMSWCGVYNTFFWIDREKGVAAVLMTQSLPALEPGAKALIDDFDRAVYASRQSSR